MGTTLTGTTPQDTYDSLIKVTDNGPISGTLKALSDGLGNDSTLSLSTAAASIAGTLAVTGNATFDTNTLFVDATNNRVGVGTITPATRLVVNRGLQTDTITIANAASYFYGVDVGLAIGQQEGVPYGTWMQSLSTGNVTFPLAINPSGGNVGIRKTNPTVPLDVTGDIRTSTGILFGTDSAAANLLDDYEEGTWTMGISFGGASVGVTTSLNSGRYTKIGNVVTVTGVIVLKSKGSSVGNATITGLPFTVGTGFESFSAASLRFEDVTGTGFYQGYANPNSTSLVLQTTTLLGVNSQLTNTNFANTSGVTIGLTYLV